MRGIKFRVFVHSRNIMAKVIAISLSENPFVSVAYDWEDEASYHWRVATYPGDDCEVMQYTGVVDKNGKEIYEGDVVRHENGRVTDVTWDNDTYSFQFDVSRWVIDQEYGCVSSGEVEVIGNIYENPNLLETK